MQKQATSKRQLGVVVPVGALRSKNSMGVGEFPDLANFALLCKKMKLGLIQLLPVNDSGFDSSPYFSLTAFALHPLYLRIEDMEEYKTADQSIKNQVNEARQKFGKVERYSHYQILKTKIIFIRRTRICCKVTEPFLKTVSERKHLFCEYRGIRTWTRGCVTLSHL